VIDDELLRGWLQGVTTTLDVPYHLGPRIPEFGRGDVLGVVTPTPGAGLALEGINEVASFQLRWVARERDYAQLKTHAYEVHRALLFADLPADLWGTRVIWVNAAGGGPSPENPDGRDLDRVMFTCTYLAETGL
jgi:hypothetical protein